MSILIESRVGRKLWKVETGAELWRRTAIPELAYLWCTDKLLFENKKEIRALWDLEIKLYNQQIKREHMLANKKGAMTVTYDDMRMLFLADGMLHHVSVLWLPEAVTLVMTFKAERIGVLEDFVKPHLILNFLWLLSIDLYILRNHIFVIWNHITNP